METMKSHGLRNWSESLLVYVGILSAALSFQCSRIVMYT